MKLNLQALFIMFRVMPEKGFPYVLPVLTDYGGDMSKEWTITYWIWHIEKKEKIRRRVSVSQPTAQERYEFAKKQIIDISRLLKLGVVVKDEPKQVVTEKIVKKKIVSAETDNSIDESIKHYLDAKKITLKKKALASYKTHVAYIQEYCKEKKITSISKFSATHGVLFLDWLSSHKRHSNRTVNNVRGTTTNFFNFLKKRELIKFGKVMSETEALPTRSQKHKAFSPLQIQQIKELAIPHRNEQLWLFLNFCYYTLARPREEIRLLKIGDIKEKTIEFQVQNAKGNLTESVIIPSALEKLIQEYGLRDCNPDFYIFTSDFVPGETPSGQNRFYLDHDAILTELNMLGNYSLYSWKHTGAIALYKKTKDIKLVQQQCRHKHITTTDKYLRDLGLFLNVNALDGMDEL